MSSTAVLRGEGLAAIDAHPADGVGRPALDSEPHERPADEREEDVEDGGVVEVDAAVGDGLDRRPYAGDGTDP